VTALGYLALAGMGAFHGLNPGMGWLFAVALGLQERSRAAVLRAFAPIALGHALSVAAVVTLVGTAQAFVSPEVLRVAGAALLVLFGVYKLLRPLAHPRWVGMRVGFRDLAAWSFVMATAHGAGLMLVPVLLQLAETPTVHAIATTPAACGVTCSLDAHAGHSMHAGHQIPVEPVAHAAHSVHTGHVPATISMSGMPVAEAAAVGVHTLAMFMVMALLALVVYEKLGLAILRRAWFNLDQLWAGALIISGAIVLVL
jgi:hypothetical protein